MRGAFWRPALAERPLEALLGPLRSCQGIRRNRSAAEGEHRKPLNPCHAASGRRER